MKKILPIASLLFFLLVPAAGAQIQRESGDPHERFMLESGKDTAFRKFQVALGETIRSARGRDIQSARAKALFEQNEPMLHRLYQQAGMRQPRNTKPEIKIVHTPQYIVSKNSILKKKIALPASFVFTKSRGYDFSWTRSAFPNGNMPKPFDTTGSSARMGRQILTSNTFCTSPSYCYIGLYQRGFCEKVTVPSDPRIIAARVKFDYTFDYDAWDSYGARCAVDLLVRTGINFQSDAYNELPDVYGGGAPTDRWKKLATLMPLDSVTTDYGELHAKANSSATIEGYVTPGSEIDLRLGFGFPKGTNKGITGNYHYAEFYLKKITVTYYKAGQ